MKTYFIKFFSLLCIFAVLFSSACGNTSESAVISTSIDEKDDDFKEVSVTLAPISDMVNIETPAYTVDNDGIINIYVSDEGNAIINLAYENKVKDYFCEDEFESKTRAALETASSPVLPQTEHKSAVTEESLDGFPYYVMTNGDNYDCVIYYIHGGAWIAGIDYSHISICDNLCESLNAKIYLPQYPLAPHYTYEDTYKMISNLYNLILKENKPVYIMGDSAGGNIALGLLHIIKEDNIKMPDKVVLLHPCADMSFSNPAMNVTEPDDPILAIYGLRESAKMWLGDLDAADPLASAIYSDVFGYPSTMMFIATRDILASDDYLLYEKMLSSGVDVTLVRGVGLYHVFETSDIPEAHTALQLITDFCKK